MFCLNCGTQLPDDARFCFKCGKSQGVQDHKTSYETCEIVFKVTGSAGLFGGSIVGHFWAKAIGPNGVYEVCKTADFKVDELALQGPAGPEFMDEKSEKFINGLISQLARDGWESVNEQGNSWWNCRFRHPAK